MNKNLCKTVLDAGGTIKPLIIPSTDSKGLGLMNPSIFIDGDKILVNLRSINYTLYHSEYEQRFNQRWGPLSYINPENDVKLKTTNFVCILNDELDIISYHKVDTSRLDIPPVWEFHGLEDARIFRWGKKLYLAGVRRDVAPPDGKGRMEMSEIEFTENGVEEVSRFRIPDPNHEDTAYCNKNWIPVLDMPNHFIKWSNPIELVKVDPKKKTCITVYNSKIRNPFTFDFRGGSQVLTINNYRIWLIHETCVYKNYLGQKDATYVQRFVITDIDWNIIHISDTFSFMSAQIEFSCGMAFHNKDLLITFGFQDNAAYVLRIPNNIINKIINFKLIK